MTRPKPKRVPAGNWSTTSFAALSSCGVSLVEWMSAAIPVEWPAFVVVNLTLLTWLKAAIATAAKTSDATATAAVIVNLRIDALHVVCVVTSRQWLA